MMWKKIKYGRKCTLSRSRLHMQVKTPGHKAPSFYLHSGGHDLVKPKGTESKAVRKIEDNRASAEKIP